MEDVRKRMKYKIINDENILPKYSASPLCLTVDIITPDLFGVKMFNPKIILNKPIFIGQAVLDYSKLQMYKLYYFTLKRCPIIRHVSLLGGDTDSFFYHSHWIPKLNSMTYFYIYAINSTVPTTLRITRCFRQLTKQSWVVLRTSALGNALSK